MLGGMLPCPDIEDINMVIDIIKDYIYSLDIPLGTSKRLNCPICNGNNTLSVTKFTDCIKYYCFHAECTKGGVIKEGLNESSFSVVNEMLETNVPVGLEVEKQNWRKNNCPQNFYDYLTDNNCSAAWSNGLADIRYDYKRDRAVFLVKDGNKVVDAAGRYIGQGLHAGPKWYRYGNCSLPYTCGKHKHAVVVEDCASATSVSNFATGVALLGTTMSINVLSRLDSFDKVTVALDKDASLKAVDIASRINHVIGDKVDIAILERDLKKLDETQAREVLRV